MKRRATQFIKDTIYQLKMEYGFPAILVGIVGESVDVDTGDVVRTVRKVSIKRAIWLELNTIRKFLPNDSAYDLNDRWLLVDYADLRGLDIKINDLAVIDDTTYVVDSVVTYDLDAAVILKLVSADAVEDESAAISVDLSLSSDMEVE